MSFDAEQQRRTQLMMAALASQGTVDELGFGPIRDLIAGKLHPGLSVLHTRAKYLLFLPRIYRSLNATSVDKLVQQGRSREGRLATQLVNYYRERPDLDSSGIIGRNTLAEAKQPASTAYWPLLRGLRILGLSGSVTQYCRDVVQDQQQRSSRSALHGEDEEEKATASRRWRELPDHNEFTGFELSADEARWQRQLFRERELTSQPGDRSLVGHLLGEDAHTWVSGVSLVWEHPRREAFPSNTADAMWLGRDLDRLVHGARILYNYLCAERRPDHGKNRDDQLERYENAMVAWRTETGNGLPSFDRLAALDDWTRDRLTAAKAGQLAHVRWRETYAFLRAWHRAAVDTDDLLHDAGAAGLLTRREESMKPGRARLTHRDRLRAWVGDSGYLRFDYNWAIARRLLTDIHAGLGSRVVALDTVT